MRLPEPPPADIEPCHNRRPNRATVTALMASDGHILTATTYTVTEDADGTPNGVALSTETGMFTTSLALLGWTPTEWANPEITE